MKTEQELTGQERIMKTVSGGLGQPGKGTDLSERLSQGSCHPQRVIKTEAN